MIEQIRETIVAACLREFGVEPIVELEIAGEQHGDFATNVALKLSKELHLPPTEVAQRIVGALHADEHIAQCGVAGPGFINIELTDRSLMHMTASESPQPLKDLRIVLEYSDPNPFKPLHAGHLYTTIVGDAIARLIEAAGAKTIRLNYGGDVGLHVSKTMWGMIQKLGGEDIEALTAIPYQELDGWLGERYAEGHAAYDNSEQARSEIIEANKKVYMLHSGDDRESNFAQLYWYARQRSYEFFAQLYQDLEVAAFDRYIPESEVTPLGIATVTEQLEKGVFTRSEGAVVFNGEAHGLHTRVFINSEGLPTYETKDVGLSLTKWKDYEFDESIIITANEQTQYMQVVIKAIEQFAPEPASRTRHITHGVVKLSGGVKMSSRLGNTVTAKDILHAATEAGRQSGNATNHSIVLAAIKYAFLKPRIGGDIIYEPSESVALEGNSGPYLQYTHARARSILRKAQDNHTHVDRPLSFEAGERLLLRKLAQKPLVLARATQELAPHYICTYLYELAQTFNRFYETHKVIGDEREQQRLELVRYYAETVQVCLGFLGISAPDTM